MPVGNRRSVCTSACLSSSRRTVSPAPPSNNTLSGTTMAARPCCFRIVKTCCRKLSCLLLVDAQKSSRWIVRLSFSASPFSFTIVTLLFLPNGGLVHDQLVIFAALATERITNLDRHVISSVRTDAVKEHVHAAQPRHPVHQFDPVKCTAR